MGSALVRARLGRDESGQGFIVEYFLSFTLFLFVFVSVLILLVQTLLPRVEDSKFYTDTMMARRATLQLLTEDAGYVQWWDTGRDSRIILNVTDTTGKPYAHRWVNISALALRNAGVDLEAVGLASLHPYEVSYAPCKMVATDIDGNGLLDVRGVGVDDELDTRLYLGKLGSTTVHLYFDRRKELSPVDLGIVDTERDYLARWGDVPGAGEGSLRSFVRDVAGASWVDGAALSKPDASTIRLASGGDWAELKLDASKTSAKLTTSGGKTATLGAAAEGGDVRLSRPLSAYFGLVEDLYFLGATEGARKGTGFDFGVSTIDSHEGSRSQLVSINWAQRDVFEHVTVGRQGMRHFLNGHPVLDLWYKVSGTDNAVSLFYIATDGSHAYQRDIAFYPAGTEGTGVWRRVHLDLYKRVRDDFGLGQGTELWLSALYFFITDAELDLHEGSTFLYLDDVALKPPDDVEADTGELLHALVVETREGAHWLNRGEVPESFGFASEGERTLNYTTVQALKAMPSIENYEELKQVLGIDEGYHSRVRILRPVSRNVINVTAEGSLYDFGTNRTVNVRVIMPEYVADLWPNTTCPFPAYTSKDPCILVILLRPDGTSVTLVAPRKVTLTERVATRYFTDAATLTDGAAVRSRSVYGTEYNFTITDPGGSYGLQAYALPAEPRGLLHGYSTFSLSR